MSEKPDGAGITETGDGRNDSMKHTSPDKCQPVSSMIIQQPHPVGDKAAPSVKG